MFTLGLVIGLIIGGNIGIVLMGLFTANKTSDLYDKIYILESELEKK